jgi:uncharacterized protein (TIGR02678 family)
MSDGDPQAAAERRAAARHLLMHPLSCLEHDPDTFRLIRRHEAELDRWFTQRLGYRLHLDADTARLHKTGAVPPNRPLRTSSQRALSGLEHTVLALVLAATSSGPAVISLRDLVGELRSAAAEAEIALADDASVRRALVAALRWMIDAGLAQELHEHVDAYATDETVDAVLRVRPDRIALLLVPSVAGCESVGDLLDRADRRGTTRVWMRARLTEEPVLYRDDLTDEEWGELRRRLGEEERLLDEMFGLLIEARAEGVAAIDPEGTLAEQRFPTGGTLGHAALLLIDRLGTRERTAAPTVDVDSVVALVTEMAEENRRRWAGEYVERPDRLTQHVIGLLETLRLGVRDGAGFRLLPAAARFAPIEPPATPTAEPPATLW